MHTMFDALALWQPKFGRQYLKLNIVVVFIIKAFITRFGSASISLHNLICIAVFRHDSHICFGARHKSISNFTLGRSTFCKVFILLLNVQ